MIAPAIPKPLWLRVRRERQLVLERAKEAGGWEALRKDCLLLAQQYNEDGFRWIRWNRSDDEVVIPPAIAARNRGK